MLRGILSSSLWFRHEILRGGPVRACVGKVGLVSVAGQPVPNIAVGGLTVRRYTLLDLLQFYSYFTRIHTHIHIYSMLTYIRIVLILVYTFFFLFLPRIYLYRYAVYIHIKKIYIYVYLLLNAIVTERYNIYIYICPISKGGFISWL